MRALLVAAGLLSLAFVAPAAALAPDTCVFVGSGEVRVVVLDAIVLEDGGVGTAEATPVAASFDVTGILLGLVHAPQATVLRAGGAAAPVSGIASVDCGACRATFDGGIGEVVRVTAWLVGSTNVGC